MQTDTFNLIARDGLRLYGKTWIPESAPRGVVGILHGFGGHIGHYESFASYLGSKGFIVMGMDTRGHGHSEGKRGFVKTGELLMSDINDLLIEVRKEYLDLPVFLFGHSMGGNLAAQYALRFRSKELKGLILSSPMFRLSFKLNKRLILRGKILNRIIPGYTLAYGMDPKMIQASAKPGTDQQFDPLVHNRISYALYTYCTRGAEWAISHASLNRVPTLVYHGEKDKITSWKASREFADNCGENATFRLLENVKHEPHNDERREEVFDYLEKWISGVLDLKKN